MRLPRYSPLPGASVLGLLLAGVAPLLVQAAEPDQPPADKPPYQRLLQGEDASGA